MSRKLSARQDGMELFADALIEYRKSGRAALYTEYSGGHLEREDVSWYFTRFAEFPSFEKQALAFASGRVLDIGLGAGRHCLYLQRRGLRVTGIDSSAALVELARERGVRHVQVADACDRLPFRPQSFDTVILFGNNLGLCGTAARFRGMLRELARITSAHGHILGSTRLPIVRRGGRGYIRTGPVRGRSVGQVRLRLRYRGKTGPWFDLLLFAPEDLANIAEKEGWVLEQVFGEDPEVGYAVVLTKSGSTRRR